ncbi:MAG: hypothetical protein ACRC18_07010 [Cetobacterium sp.]
MNDKLISKVVNCPAVGQYVVTIDYINSTIVSCVNTNISICTFVKDDIISLLLEVAPNTDINDFIIDILADPEYQNYFDYKKI